MTYLGRKILIHLVCKVQIPLLVAKKVTILTKYLDFLDIFSKKSTVELFKYFDINKHLINSKLNKQLSYNSIYNLKLVELKTVKTYIKTNLANNFIYLSKSFVGAPILFI